MLNFINLKVIIRSFTGSTVPRYRKSPVSFFLISQRLPMRFVHYVLHIKGTIDYHRISQATLMTAIE